MSAAQERPVPLVIALGADLMFGSRLESVVTRAGARFAMARSVDQLRARAGAPTLVLLDLGARGLDVEEAVRAARDAGAGSVVAYGPHKDVESRRRALDAGCDRWLPNSRIFEALPDLLSTAGRR